MGWYLHFESHSIFRTGLTSPAASLREGRPYPQMTFIAEQKIGKTLELSSLSNSSFHLHVGGWQNLYEKILNFFLNCVVALGKGEGG